jgi:hypothetical protein
VNRVEWPVETPSSNSSGLWSTAGIRSCCLRGLRHTAAHRGVAERFLMRTPSLAHVVRVFELRSQPEELFL